jgi:hypothetical protein
MTETRLWSAALDRRDRSAHLRDPSCDAVIQLTRMNQVNLNNFHSNLLSRMWFYRPLRPV